jgi:hypothetical protein
MFQLLYLWGNSFWYPIYKRVDGIQSEFGHGSEERNSLPMAGI